MPVLRRLLPAIAVAALAVAGYLGSLGGELVFDDLRHLQANPLLRDLGSYLRSLDGYRASPNRFVGFLSFALNYRLAGLDVASFRAVNVAIHALNALLVLALVRTALRSPRLAGSAIAASDGGGDAKGAGAVAFLAAALFAAHPLQTEAVTYLVQRFTSLAALFYLAAVLLYLRWRLAAPGRPAARAASYLAILALAGLALRTKESAFTLPLAAGLVELALLEGTWRTRLAALAPLAALTLGLALVSNLAAAPFQPALGNTAATGQGGLGALDYLLTQCTVLPRYLGLLLLPIGQNADPDVAVRRSLDLPVAGGAALLLLVAGAACWLLRQAERRRLDPAVRLIAFGVLWFFVASAVESSLVPLADVMAERRAYLPSAGVFTALAAAAALLGRRLAPVRWPAALAAAGLALGLALAAATAARNRVWRDEVSLWSDAAAGSPGKPRPHLNLGVAWYERGRVDDAIRELRRAVALAPEWAEAHANLGIACLARGLREEGVREMMEGGRLRAGGGRREAGSPPAPQR